MTQLLSELLRLDPGLVIQSLKHVVLIFYHRHVSTANNNELGSRSTYLHQSLSILDCVFVADQLHDLDFRVMA